jgi:hypothetical protein
LFIKFKMSAMHVNLLWIIYQYQSIPIGAKHKQSPRLLGLNAFKIWIQYGHLMRIYSTNVNKKLKSIDSFQSLHNLFRCSNFRITLFSKNKMSNFFWPIRKSVWETNFYFFDQQANLCSKFNARSKNSNLENSLGRHRKWITQSQTGPVPMI